MAWKFQQIEPQPARGKFSESLWTDPNWIAEEKYDGDRRIAQFCGKVVRFTGRRISVKDGLFVEKTANVPHLAGLTSLGNKHARGIIGSKAPPAALDGTVLDGEMIFNPAVPCAINVEEGGRSKYVTSIMGSLPEEAVKKQIERGWLRYVVFDCLFYKGKDIRHMQILDRQEYVAETLAEWRNPFVTAAISVGGSGKREVYEEIVKRGGEGVILKHRQHRYGDKSGWAKVKKTATADVVIMGFKDAKEVSKKKGEDKATLTKYAKAGLIGAVVVGQRQEGRHELVEVATISGMDDVLRRYFTDNPKKCIGLVCEIEHNGREPTGRFRHPRWNRWRPDKRAIDCVMREDES